MHNLENSVVTNAAGMVKTQAEAEKLLDSAVTRITLGSYTPKERPGNLGVTYYHDPVTGTAWNSKGLNNQGVDELLTWLPDFYEKCKASGKELAVSLAGFSPEQYAQMAGRVASYCDLIEINAGCGNVWKDNQQKPIPSYEPDLLNEILHQMNQELDVHGIVSVKISPVDDDVLPGLARVLNFTRALSVVEVVGTNTKPNQKPEPGENGNERLAWREDENTDVKHTGGMSGTELREDSMRVLRNLRPLIPGVRYIYCGAVSEGNDAVEALDAGADGFAIGTAFFERGRKVFGEVLLQADAILSNR